MSDNIWTEIKNLWREIDILKAFDIPMAPVYGSFYCEDAAITVNVTTAGLYYPVVGGMTQSLCKGITFNSIAATLRILSAGLYEVKWHMSLSCNNPNETLEGLVFAGTTGATAQLHTVSAARVAAANTVGAVGGCGLIMCAVGDLIRLGVENETASGHVITVNHAGIVVMKVG